MKDFITKTAVTLLIGGTIFTVSQVDIVQNFAEDTGLTQEQAEQYINEIPEDELISFDELGDELIGEGQIWIDAASDIDCINYEYEWESNMLSCSAGKSQIGKLGKDYRSLGQVYLKLGSDSASKDDISKAINLIEQLVSDYKLEVVSTMFSLEEIDEMNKTILYNKAVLKAALESD
ncbi:MAG: hypothetical protein PHY39_06470 [Endomicrobiaceae bacterium]|nr:hypothetical protein [Endomicrobiaceae bacterium]